LLGFIFGIWANPTPAPSAGAVIVSLLRDARPGSQLWVVLGAALAGAITPAIGSVMGRSVFGSWRHG
jgi:hypothetical protein